MRFRLCCWPLAANRLCASVPREQRVCRVCGTGVVEDEYHALLECPAYADLRVAAEFCEGATMRDIMTEGNQAKLAELLSKIWKSNSWYRVCRPCLEPPARTWVVALAEGRTRNTD